MAIGAFFLGLCFDEFVISYETYPTGSRRISCRNRIIPYRPVRRPRVPGSTSRSARVAGEPANRPIRRGGILSRPPKSPGIAGPWSSPPITRAKSRPQQIGLWTEGAGLPSPGEIRLRQSPESSALPSGLFFTTPWFSSGLLDFYQILWRTELIEAGVRRARSRFGRVIFRILSFAPKSRGSGQ